MSKIRSIKEMLKKFNFILTASHKRWGVIVIIMTIVGAICETVGVSIILPLVQVMIEPQQLRSNPLFIPIIEGLKLNTNKKLIWTVGFVVIAVYLLKNLFLLLLSYVRIKYSCKVQRELSVEMMDSYMKRGYVFFINNSTAELMRGMQAGIQNTYTALNQMFKLLAEALTILFICIYIMSTDIVIAICVIILASVCLLGVVLGCQKWVKRCGEITYEYAALISKVLLQTFLGIKEVLVMNRQKYFIDSYKKNYIKQQKGVIGQTVAAESPAYMIEAVCVSGLIVAVCLKAIDVENAEILVPELASFAVAAFRILPSLGRISNYYNSFTFCVPGVNDTYENFIEVREKSYEDKPNDCRKEITWQGFNRNISLEHIEWKYPVGDKIILEDVSLVIKKGQSVAFIGKSGAGKTTLADIILGLLEPQCGMVKIDGINMKSISDERSRFMGFVPQSVNLLDDTVRRNVAFGIEDKDIDDRLVWRALEQAQLKDVIENSNKGLDTEIGERGIRFSGGQKQRFAIARALYSNPDILVLDEATSALDTETENAVMDAINVLRGEKTLIIIAHRLSTIRNCDCIYEIIDGKIVERKYEDLV